MSKPRDIFDVVMAYRLDSLVEDLTSSIVYLQLAKLQGKPISKFRYNVTTKSIDAVELVGNYEERSTLLASILLKHIKTYYPELLEDMH